MGVAPAATADQDERMRRCPIALIVAASILGPGCSGGGVDMFKVELESMPAEARFRWEAGRVYEELFTPSCGAPASFNRPRLLALSARRIKAFETSNPAPVRLQLAIAREDAAYEQQVDGGCFNDSDPWFRKEHLKRSRKEIDFRLNRMEALARDVARFAPRALPRVNRAAEFRYLVRELVDATSPLCRISRLAEDDVVLAPARAEISRFNKRLEGTPLAAHYEIAEADVRFLKLITQVDCADPGPEPVAELQQEYLSSAQQQIAAIEARFPPG